MQKSDKVDVKLGDGVAALRDAHHVLIDMLKTSFLALSNDRLETNEDDH